MTAPEDDLLAIAAEASELSPVDEGARALAGELEAALATAPFERREPPAAVWERIERGVRAEREGHGPATALRILLACTFCKGGLDRKEALYCAACLAPHHRDCLETHGRCAAMGCGETRLIAPRESGARSRTRRRFGAIVALMFAAPVAALVATAARRPATLAPAPTAALAAVGEPETVPAWPWEPPESSRPDPRLDSKRISFDFAGARLRSVIAHLSSATEVSFVVDPSVDPDAIRVDLRLHDVVARDALAIIANQAWLVFKREATGLRVVARSSMPELAAYDRHAEALALLGEDDGDNAVLRHRLATQRVAVHVADSSLEEALEMVNALTGVPVVIGTGARDRIDASPVHVSLDAEMIPVRDALERLLAPAGLAAEPRNGAVFVRERVTAAVPTIGTTRVKLAGRGLTVASLVEALRALGIEAYAAESAWRSRGTFSCLLDEMPLSDALAAIAATTPLRFRIERLGSDRDVVLVEGRIASARSALESSVPALAGVEAEIASLRERLTADLVVRHAAREDATIAAAELQARERAVELSASAILSLLRRAETVRQSGERLTKVLAATAAEIAAVESWRSGLVAAREHLKVNGFDKHELEARAQLAEWRVEEFTLAKGFKWTEAKALEAQVAAARTDDERNELRGKQRIAEDMAIESGRKAENERHWLADLPEQRARLRDEGRAIELRGTVAQSQSRWHEARLSELQREEGVIRRDFDVLRRLERGARMAEAEGR